MHESIPEILSKQEEEVARVSWRQLEDDFVAGVCPPSHRICDPQR
ncbi:MAG: hypothetical protein K0S70_3686 [Microbacterium sp.]|jgi:hypothetical protein|nr:hypothetical protein [Microbacterium sp.]